MGLDAVQLPPPLSKPSENTGTGAPPVGQNVAGGGVAPVHGQWVGHLHRQHGVGHLRAVRAGDAELANAGRCTTGSARWSCRRSRNPTSGRSSARGTGSSRPWSRPMADDRAAVVAAAVHHQRERVVGHAAVAVDAAGSAVFGAVHASLRQTNCGSLILPGSPNAWASSCCGWRRSRGPPRAATARLACRCPRHRCRSTVSPKMSENDSLRAPDWL